SPFYFISQHSLIGSAIDYKIPTLLITSSSFFIFGLPTSSLYFIYFSPLAFSHSYPIYVYSRFSTFIFHPPIPFIEKLLCHSMC
ncbi:MAG: hypothetical protein J7L26_10045, partial [Candidatus Aminicenantes bacterium]|nr:hypothetical protein [Candidatus Aminicenantes bacterium]